MKKKKLFYFELTPGMIVAQDIYTHEGQLIVTANTVLTEGNIVTISQHSVFEVLVNIPEDESEAIKAPEPEKETPFITSPSYSERIKNSNDFKVFKSNYLDNVAETKDFLNDIVNKNVAIDPKTFIANSANLLSQCNTGIHIFDMLHNMRDYDDSTHIHSVNVGLIAAIIGKWLNFSEDDINTLILCGMLHDIGKLTVPIEILTKPARLTTEEYKIIKNHTVNGYNLLKSQDIDIRAKEAALFHHERCDGSGYPLNLTGNRIPLFSKIISIADVYDAMTANRVYRNGLCPFEVIRIFEEEGLHRYDPMIIITFLQNIVQTYLNNSVRLNDGTIGEIIMINRLNLTRPIIKTATNCIDLSKEPKLKIEAII